MRASSICWEFYIMLQENELLALEKRAINGEVKVHDRDKVIGNFPLELKIDYLNDYQLYVELSTYPEKVYFREAKEYKIKISNEGYKKLMENGEIGDRMFNNSYCKIYIKKQNNLN